MLPRRGMTTSTLPDAWIVTTIAQITEAVTKAVTKGRAARLPTPIQTFLHPAELSTGEIAAALGLPVSDPADPHLRGCASRVGPNQAQTFSYSHWQQQLPSVTLSQKYPSKHLLSTRRCRRIPHRPRAFRGETDHQARPLPIMEAELALLRIQLGVIGPALPGMSRRDAGLPRLPHATLAGIDRVRPADRRVEIAHALLSKGDREEAGHARRRLVVKHAIGLHHHSQGTTATPGGEGENGLR
eukprot:m.491456 g.491456  ORF g.491456 m.491456 type:complete len:242 (+) comp57263_c0_seq1:1051-1776(+)